MFSPIKRVQEKQGGPKQNGTLKLLAYADDVNILGVSTELEKRNTGEEISTESS
jgi:hypothetical protein